MIQLIPFHKDHYAIFMSWIDSAETLMQIAGPNLQYPVTPEQLDTSSADPNRTPFCIVSTNTREVIGHAEIYITDHSAKLGRVIIGDPAWRGKGLGKQLMQLLVNYAFTHFDKPMVELNVFDWNTAAIKCYEKVGFTVTPGKTLERTVNNQVWIAVNMTIDKKNWQE